MQEETVRSSDDQQDDGGQAEVQNEDCLKVYDVPEGNDGNNESGDTEIY